MAHDVFINYSSKDKAVADAVCATLEARGMRCWIAPRDVQPGADWSEAVARAIAESRVMVLVFSSKANESEQVRRKVNLAIEREVAIAPFRIENVMPSGSLKNYLDVTHWLDALTPPLEAHIDKLADNLTRLLAERERADAAPVAETPQTPARERRGINKVLLVTSVLGVLALAALIGIMAYRWSRSGRGGGGGRGDGGGGGGRPVASAETPTAEANTGPISALHCTPPENYELRCRGGGEMVLSLDRPGESGRRLLKIRFKRGSKPASAGLSPGECAWVDRPVGGDEPNTIIRYVSGPNVPVVTSLKDANKYWGFCASDRGDYFGVLESGRAN
ncbi:MAG TPA: toll/interleukin-1 receptor domain-containing protein [Pyrinomonadaceae bacterium]|nr:toll/interleukin-1 receptor domain-containing protein [Pyrinomonadaceae bacterium]